MITARLLAVLFCTAPAAFAAGDVPLTWKGKTYTTAAIPPDLSAAQREAVVRFTPWAAGAGYRMDFDVQGRMLLITPKGRSRLADSLRLLGKTETWFDTVLPAPPRAPAPKPAEASAPTRPGSEPIPEDPESPPPTPVGGGSRPGTGSATPPAPQSAWGSGSVEPDSITAVLIVAHDEKDYGTLIEELARGNDYLKDWLEEARKQTGFTLEEPLAGAYVENASGQEEWNGDHELMNRAVQLLTLRRFGQQPNWLLQGIAWECEIQTDGLVYCFPFRKEFVFTAEHGGWPTEVKNMMKERAGKPIDVAELAAWKRGTWNATAAKLAWGFTHHLVGQGPGKLSAALEDLRAARNLNDRRQTSPTAWERIKGYELPAEMQTEALVARFGKDVLKDASASMRSGTVKVTKDKEPTVGAKKSARKS